MKTFINSIWEFGRSSLHIASCCLGVLSILRLSCENPKLWPTPGCSSLRWHCLSYFGCWITWITASGVLLPKFCHKETKVLVEFLLCPSSSLKQLVLPGANVSVLKKKKQKTTKPMLIHLKCHILQTTEVFEDNLVFLKYIF